MIISELLVASLVSFGGIGWVAVYFLLYPEKWQIIISHLCGFVEKCHIFSAWVQKQRAKNDIEGTINNLIVKIKLFIPELNGYKINVKWVPTSEEETYIKEQRVYICLRTKRGRENLSEAIYHYVCKILLYDLQRHLYEEQKQALILYVTSEILFLSSYGALRAQFMASKVQSASQKVREYFNMICDIDRHGYFYSMFLRELYFLGNKLSRYSGLKVVADEALEFQVFMHNIALRDVGANTPLTIQKQYIKCALVIIGKANKVYDADGSEKYAGYIKTLYRDKIENVYLLIPFEHQIIMGDVILAVKNEFEKCIEAKTKITLNTMKGPFEQKAYIIALRNYSVFKSLSPMDIKYIETCT